MSEPETPKASSAEFDQLQQKLVPLWKSIERFNQDPQTIVVVPSMSIDAIDSGAVIQAYEERFLFLLLLLRQPRARAMRTVCGSDSQCRVQDQQRLANGIDNVLCVVLNFLH